MDKFNTIALAKAMITNKVPAQFSDIAKNETALREALIEANGGSTKVNYKTLRRNKVEIFEIIEEIIPTILVEGLRGDEFFMNLVDYRNVALGDDIDFYAEDKAEFIVATIAHGSQGVYRQKLNAGEKLEVKTQLKGIKVYGELDLFLAGRIDWNTYIQKVFNAMKKKYLESIYETFNGITSSTSGMNSTYYISGTFDATKLNTLIAHVEAATGKPAIIFGTKAGLASVVSAVVSDEAKSDIYNIGYYGKFDGTKMVSVRQAHKAGTDTFLIDDTKLWIIASDDKPIKMVDKGEGLMIETDADSNADLTKEYLYGQEYGVGLLINGKLGIMDM